MAFNLPIAVERLPGLFPRARAEVFPHALGACTRFSITTAPRFCAFIAQLAAGEPEILQRRNRLLDEIFAATPDASRIEAERAAIARLQDERQRIVIEQLRREREILDAAQRARLAQLLRSQPAGVSGFEKLHRN